MNSKKKFIYSGVLALFSFTAVFSQSNVSPSVKYHSTSNTIEKRAALRQVGKVTSTPQTSPGVALSMHATCSQEDIALLKEALSDSDPTVVEQAVMKVGELQVVQLNDSILNVYAKADAIYGGYSERVKLAVIDAVGDIGLPDNAGFLNSRISEGIHYPYIHHVLLATKKLYATSTIPDLQKLINKYTVRCQNAENAHANPLVLSSLYTTLNEAKDVLTTLTTTK